MRKVPGTYGKPRARIWRGPIPGTHEPGFVEQPIIERDDLQPAHIVYQGGPEYELHAFQMGECRILLGHEPVGVGDDSRSSSRVAPDGAELRWHMTISCLDRHPTWDEIKTARYRLLGPDLNTAMFLPPADEYVNYEAQDHVFQVWEVG